MTEQRPQTIRILIESSSDHFSAYADQVDGIFGAGDTPRLVRQNILEAIGYIQQMPICPKELQGEYRVAFFFDVDSFLHHFGALFSIPVLERLTGIQPNQLFHTQKANRKKIEKALHLLGEELLDIRL